MFYQFLALSVALLAGAQRLAPLVENERDVIPGEYIVVLRQPEVSAFGSSGEQFVDA